MLSRPAGLAGPASPQPLPLGLDPGRPQPLGPLRWALASQKAPYSALAAWKAPYTALASWKVPYTALASWEAPYTALAARSTF